MSRGIKDLRELVVVSRLSYRDSDSESDDNRGGMITPFESLDVTSHLDPDKDGVESSPTPPSSADSGLGKSKKKKKKRPTGYNSMVTASPVGVNSKLHEFPRSKPLPAVGSAQRVANGSVVNHPNRKEVIKGDYSMVIGYLDEDIVADWLQRANQHLKDLTHWCTDRNFVKFAQFWIRDFCVDKRCEILALEYSILLDELNLAVRNGLELCKIQQKDIADFLAALLREYPKKLTAPSGVYLFLDYLDIFTSERTLEYRNILSDVKISTKNKDHVHLILASRCFMLINIWVAILNFYRQLYPSDVSVSSDHLSDHRDKQVVVHDRVAEAINLGLTEVVHYFLFSGKLSAGFIDFRKKTLLHSATAANQPQVVEYLLKKWTGCIDVNRPCDTGNTPLHVAVNLGNAKIVQLLLNMPDIDVSKGNDECDGATPLHLAVLHGNVNIVRMLLKRGGDTKKLMNGQTALQLAQDFSHFKVAEILMEKDVT